MPKNNVTDPITDQEMAFVHMVLSGAVTDRRAAEAVGLDPDSAAYTKSKPRVRAYMHQHQAAVQQRLVEQEAEGLRRLQISRDQILGRLWEIASLSPELTRGSISGQVKALAMMIAIEGLVPDRAAGRRAHSAQKQPASPPVPPENDVDSWPPGQETVHPDPSSLPVEQEPGRVGDPPPALAGATFVSPPDAAAPFSIRKNVFNQRR